MWISFQVVPSEELVIYLPNSFKKTLENLSYLHFGNNFILAQVEYDKNTHIPDDNSYEKPTKIKITKALKENLLIPDDLTLQLKISKEKILIGPVIGLLLGNHAHLYSPAHMKKYSDRFGIYPKIGGLFYAFSLKNIDFEDRKVYGLYYNNINSKWEYGIFPLPTVIYRRNFHTDEKIIKKLKELTDNKLFNSYRFDKYEMQEFVMKSKELSNHTIPTKLSTNFTTVKAFIDNYEKIILKPIDLSRGRGICIIGKIDDTYLVKDYRSRIKQEILLETHEELQDFFNKNPDFFNNYIIQKHIDLAKVEGRVYDIRVVMHKNSKNKWNCSGIECRVAPESSLITNISKGGYALSLEDALKKSFLNYNNHKFLGKQVIDFCENLCMHMDTMNHHFGEFGIDVAFDIYRKLWLIEMNVFPSFKGFKTFDYNTYLTIRQAPFIYAASLTEFKDSI